MLHNCMVNQIKEIIRQRLPIYAMLSKTYLLNLIKCGKELKDLQEAINQRLLWSLKDTKNSGFLLNVTMPQFANIAP
ncbi:hypothetical protein HZH66_000794 [Vespula vulgaris]|uniref:Uncharacterized protein n=1 Tax=Vespula vulgaris TaxID=7454 RepID=A0A834KS25_VESVU|nr:hypothetical protein HZH66_000794 [Vespula vulgaris]